MEEEGKDEEKIHETCPICEGHFDIQSEWKAHLWSKHENAVAIYRNSVFDLPAILLQSLSGSSLYHRPVIDILQLPLEKKTERLSPKSFQCFSCLGQFTTLCGLQTHSALRHQGDWVSGVAPWSFRPDWSDCAETLLSCSVCSGCFSANQIGPHLGIHRSDSNGISCEICETKFKSSQEIRSHYVSVHTDLFGKEKFMSVKVLRRMRPSANWNRVTENSIPQEEQTLPPIQSWPPKDEPSNANSIGVNSANLKCSTCEKVFNHIHAKFLHERTKACKNFRCRCDICGRRFGSWWKVRRHKSQVHKVYEQNHGQNSTTASRTCDRCGKIFQNIFQKKQHDQFRACDPSRYTCPKCNTRYASRASVLRHMRRTHGVNTSSMTERFLESSPKSEDLTKNLQSADRNDESAGIEFVKANLTGKPSIEIVTYGAPQAEEPDGYLSDVSANSGTVPISEPNVTVSVVTTDVSPSRTSTSTTVLQAEVGSNQCMICGREFSRSSDLTKHLQYNVCDPKLKECTICGRVLSSRAKLKRHTRLVHSGVM